jgi:hypothetical protein
MRKRNLFVLLAILLAWFGRDGARGQGSTKTARARWPIRKVLSGLPQLLSLKQSQ